ncbi:hypothetical protein MJD09_27720 [bacterium]|nr:hypothetical protein [bacterium]
MAAIYGNFFFDKTLENAMERAMESVTGSTVEIDDLKFYFRGPSLAMAGLRIADPQDSLRNMFDIGHIGFHVETRPLLWKSLFLKDLFIADIQFSTKRDIAGRRYDKDPAKARWIQDVETILKNHLDAPPLLEVLSGQRDAHALLPYLDLEPITKVSQMRSRLDSVSREWNLFRKNFEAQLTSLRGAALTNSSPDNSSDPPSQLDLMRATLDSAAAAVKGDFERHRHMAKKLTDLTATENLALPHSSRLLAVTPELATKIVFGELVIHQADKLLQYVDIVRRFIPGRYEIGENRKTKNPRRFSGQDILLPLTHSPPSVGIGKIQVQCPPRNQPKTHDVFVRGSIQGPSLDPKDYENRLSIRMRTTNPNPTMTVVIGALDHSGATPSEQFQLGVSGTDMLQLNLHDRPLLPKKILIDRGDLSGNVEIVGSDLNALLSLASIKTSFSFPDSAGGDGPLAREISRVLEGQERFNLSTMIFNSAEEIEIRLESNIGGLLLEPLQQAVNEMLEREYSIFASSIPTFITTKIEDLDEQINRQENRFENQLSALRDSVAR